MLGGLWAQGTTSARLRADRIAAFGGPRTQAIVQRRLTQLSISGLGVRVDGEEDAMPELNTLMTGLIIGESARWHGGRL